MKKVLFMVVCLFVTGIAMQSCKPSDDRILSEVEKVLKDNRNMITPTVSNGVVTLIGSVGSEQEKQDAEAAVRSVKDVKSVNSNLTIIERTPEGKSEVINTDETIMSSITTALGVAKIRNVDVEVKNGEVTLSGKVKKIDLERVMQIANEANPVKINNNLTLK